MILEMLLTQAREQKLLTSQTYKARDIVFEQGQVSQQIFFVQKGCLRMWHLAEDGREITTQFFFEGSMVALIESFYEQRPSDYGLQALEDCQIQVLGREDFWHLLENDKESKDRIIALLLSRMTKYNKLFLSRIKYSPEERYQELVAEHAELLERVPDQYLASYLGITPVSFSRIKKRLS